jgi:hypothetical protein
LFLRWVLLADRHHFYQSSDELTVVVEDLLNSLSNKFAGVSSEIFAKSTWQPTLDQTPFYTPAAARRYAWANSKPLSI